MACNDKNKFKTSEASTKAALRTQGVIDLAPYTFGVSAKSYNFDENGNELTVDFKKYIEILREHDFD